MWFGVLLAFLMLFPVRVLAQTGSPARMIPRTSMTIQVVSEETDTSPAYLKGNAIDGNPSNFWHSNFTPSAQDCAAAPNYCWVILNLGATYNTNKLIYWPALSNLAGGSPQNNGRVGDYHIYVTTDAVCTISSTWTEVATGSWQNNIDTKRAVWAATPTRCVKLESRANASGTTDHMHAAEIAVFEEGTFPTETPTAGANADFIARCTAPGVTVCYSFDQAPTGASLNHMPNQAGEDVGVNLTLAADGQLRITRDTTYKVSGAGSLVFTAPPPPHGGPSIAGNFELNPNINRSIAGGSDAFGPHEDMYVQFWRRQTNETQFNTWREENGTTGAGMKYFTFYRYPTPCTELNLVLHTYFITDIITGYSNCGQVSWATIPNTATWKTTTSPFWQQGGDVGCQYASWKNCYFDEPDIWTNYYCKFHIGSLPKPIAQGGVTVFDSTVECWYARQGDTAYKKFINITDGYFLHSTTENAGFNSFELLMYMTDVDPTSGDPNVTSKVYFDELIISTQPIAMPGLSAGTAALSGGGLGSGGGRF